MANLIYVSDSIYERLLTKYFPDYNGDGIKFTDVSMYSSTPSLQSDITVEILKKYIPLRKDLTITDASSCIGADAAKFCKYFYRVNCVEPDRTNMKALKNNLTILGFSNVEYFEEEYQKLNLKQDILYFDPPWGGPSYKDKSNIRLFYGKAAIEDLLQKTDFEVAILKLPLNYDVKYLRGRFPVTDSYRIFGHKKNKEKRAIYDLHYVFK